MKTEDMMKNHELYHHGIKGQKWGVRRYQNYDGTRIKDGEYRIVKKGTTVQKISSEKIDNLTSRRMYVSYKKKDNDKYQRDADNYSKGKNYAYKNMYKVIKDLKVPTDEVVTNELLNSHILFQAYHILERENHEYLSDEKGKWFEDELIDYYINENKSDRARKLLTSDGFEALYYSGLTTSFVQTFAEKGYDAVKDYQDAWIYAPKDLQYTEDPLIILNPDKSLKYKKSIRFNKE